MTYFHGKGIIVWVLKWEKNDTEFMDKNASAGNRTRVDSLEGYNSTSKLLMLLMSSLPEAVIFTSNLTFPSDYFLAIIAIIKKSLILLIYHCITFSCRTFHSSFRLSGPTYHCSLLWSIPWKIQKWIFYLYGFSSANRSNE